MTELPASAGSEGYVACDDEAEPRRVGDVSLPGAALAAYAAYTARVTFPLRRQRVQA